MSSWRRFIRPSFLPVMAECSASPQMSAAVVDGFGEPKAEDVMELGNDMHACVMLALQPLVADPRAKHAGEEAIAKFPMLSAWDRSCVWRCIKFAVDLVRQTIAAFPDDQVEVLIEHHLDGSVIGIDRGGSADFLVVVPFKLVRIVDWKCGFLDQGEAADHDQLATYAVMGAATFTALAVEVFLYQPRAEEAHRASGARFDGAALKAQLTWTRSVVEAATDDNPELRAGLHCTKCRGLPGCAKAKEFFMRVRDALELIGDPTNPDAWGDLCDAVAVASKFGEVGKALAKERLQKGLPITRWQLQSSGSQTKIDPKLAIKLARDAGVLDHLLEHATFKAEAAKAVEAIARAATKESKAPSLKPFKAASAEAVA